MDVEPTQVSNEESGLVQEDNPRRRRKKAINSASRNSMDHISVEFVLPTTTRGGKGPDTLQLDVAGNWTVEQVTRLICKDVNMLLTVPFVPSYIDCISVLFPG